MYRVFDNNVDQSANENDSRKRKKKRKNVKERHSCLKSFKEKSKNAENDKYMF